MPFLKDSSSTGSSVDGLQKTSGRYETVLEDFEYPALSFPSYAEKPLSEQLEPIAVVGMGKFIHYQMQKWNCQADHTQVAACLAMSLVPPSSGNS